MNPTQKSSFPGGNNALFAFIEKNSNLPKEQIKGNIKVAFITTIDGSICDFRVISGSNDNLENEVIRIFKLMPKWNPAIDNGKIVDCYNYMKLVFKKNASTQQRLIPNAGFSGLQAAVPTGMICNGEKVRSQAIPYWA
jgi:hypothetical protein